MQITSGSSIARFAAGTADYWTWWSGLPEVIRSGRPFGHHDAPADDPYWQRYISGQLELARLSAREVARKLSSGAQVYTPAHLHAAQALHSADPGQAIYVVGKTS